MTFWSSRKNGLIRKINLTSKFMTSQPGLKTVANISQSKDNQSIKFGQLIECKRDVFFFKNCVENEAGRLVAEFTLFFKKFNMR